MRPFKVVSLLPTISKLVFAAVLVSAVIQSNSVSGGLWSNQLLLPYACNAERWICIPVFYDSRLHLLP